MMRGSFLILGSALVLFLILIISRTPAQAVPPASSVCLFDPELCVVAPELPIASIEKTGPAQVSAGQTATFNLHYSARRNDGTDRLRICGLFRVRSGWLYLEDQLPPGFSFESANPPPWQTKCGGRVIWDSTILDPDNDGIADGTVMITTKIAKSVCIQHPGGTATNQAFISLFPGNGQTTTTTTSLKISVCPLPTPTLSSITPKSGTQGTSLNVVLQGANFVPGATVSVSGTGVTVSNVTVVSGSQITATFTIAGNAPIGARNVTVSSGAGTSNPVTFTVNPASPRPGLSCTVTPITVTPGQPFTLSCASTFTNSITSSVTGSGCPVAGDLTPVGSGSTPVTATKTLTAPTSATTCNYTITATGPGGTTTTTVTVTVGLATSCSLLVCINYDPRVITLPPPGFTRIVQPFISEVAP